MKKKMRAWLRNYFGSQLRISDMVKTTDNVFRKFNVLGELPSLRRYCKLAHNTRSVMRNPSLPISA